MARKIKNKNIVIRVDESLNSKLTNYADKSDTTVAQVVRQAINEYIWAHPLPTKPYRPVQENA